MLCFIANFGNSDITNITILQPNTIYKPLCIVGQMPARQVNPIAKKLRIPQAKFNAVNTKLVRFAHIFGVKNKIPEIILKIMCNLPGLPNGLFCVVLLKPVKYNSGLFMITHFWVQAQPSSNIAAKPTKFEYFILFVCFIFY